ncbi:propionyl-CoA synthetase [Thermomonospora echinospora]|uniref:Propionyl-CoA synthetase n=1 Tax=Thermomonospora echinospora TaxID=1992 RepID=A0A1H6BZL5_9ACTN|nr:AMP-binding protein [Thermomonospora echinospora]SEG65875.1 propionyl-CoA synthetase [Thermomonospora echinospora]
MGAYAAAYQRSITDPARFWGLAARDIRWLAPPDRVLDDGAPPFYRWFTGGELNTCDNALDRHVVAGRGDQPALVCPGGDSGPPRAYTYMELTDLVARFAGVLAGLGAEPGDRVLVHLPMTPEAVIAVLACARLGVVHVAPSGGPDADALAAQIDVVRPKVIVSAAEDPAGSAKPVLDAALRLASHKVGHRVILRGPGGTSAVPPRDVDWDEAMAAARPAGCVPVAATDPLHVLFTPGTAGPAKGVVHDNGGYAVALRWSMEHLYGVGPGEVFGATCDLGWPAGLSSAIYAPLLTGCTLLLHEGGGAFLRVIAEHRVKGALTTPATIRALRERDGDRPRGHDLSALEAVFLAGERPDAGACAWASRALGRPVTGQWERPETGRPIAAAPRGLEPVPVRAGVAGPPTPGFDVQALGPDGRPVPPGTDGELGLRLPLPPGALATLWRDDERFVEAHLARYPGYYLTGDVGHLDEDGHVRVTGRAGARDTAPD